MKSVIGQIAEYLEIGEELANGLTIREIATKLDYSQRKVTGLISELKCWTGGKTHAEIVAYLIRKGLIK
ncbi:MAG: hypothetical protein GYA15_12890 [Leptolinea sp.]|nr:hypothetical protein [Leptolinea sp.]